jgi:hypothetical protein
VGFESLSEKNLKSSRKKHNDPKQYREIVKKLHDQGMAISGALRKSQGAHDAVK